VDSKRKPAAPSINETMVLDTKQRREMLQQAAAMGERSQFAGRLKMPTLVVLTGNSDQKEYVITSKLAVIGKSKMATVRLKAGSSPRSRRKSTSATMVITSDRATRLRSSIPSRSTAQYG